MLLEICVDSLNSAIAAEKGGADRLELCADLGAGGLTPSMGLVDQVLGSCRIPVMVLIRCRTGDFCYDPNELATMMADISWVAARGVAGVVIGALSTEGKVDQAATIKMKEAAAGLDITFHRAFDLVSDPFQAYEMIRELGIRRILTSGQASNAILGRQLIADLQQSAGADGAIMAGGGIDASNVHLLLAQTTIREVHASCKSSVMSKMTHQSKTVAMGASSDDYKWWQTDESKVKALKNALREAREKGNFG